MKGSRIFVNITDHGDIRATDYYAKEHHSPAGKTVDSGLPSRASETALKSLDEFTEDILAQLCDDKTIFAAAVERGIFRPHIPKKRIQLKESDEELAEKRYKETCLACGRQGHKKQDCSFLEQGHPDSNIENVPWAEY